MLTSIRAAFYYVMAKPKTFLYTLWSLIPLVGQAIFYSYMVEIIEGGRSRSSRGLHSQLVYLMTLEGLHYFLFIFFFNFLLLSFLIIAPIFALIPFVCFVFLRPILISFYLREGTFFSFFHLSEALWVAKENFRSVVKCAGAFLILLIFYFLTAKFLTEWFFSGVDNSSGVMFYLCISVNLWLIALWSIVESYVFGYWIYEWLPALKES